MLLIRLDQNQKKLSISGSSTFAAKEEIKRLGPARFDGPAKMWVVSPFNGSVEDVNRALGHFPITFDDIVLSDAPPEVVEESTAPKGFSVPELIFAAKKALEERFSEKTLVYGVISSLKASGEHCFLTLADPKDRTTAVSCAIWGNGGASGLARMNRALEPHGVKLDVDLEVMFQVEVSLKPKSGNLSLVITRVVPEYTLSKLLGEREKTNARLKEEGLFEKNRRDTTLPFFPTRFGVLTSASGTVIHDFMGGLELGGYGFQLLWYPVSVQGSEAKRSILKGLQYFTSRGEVDAILLFRGGGSVSDLAVFNDYEVAKAICLSPLPVISAIGHQEDQCSTQDVSHRAFGVPRDIGKFFADRVLEQKQFLQQMSERFVSVSESILERTETLLKSTADLLFQQVFRVVELSQERLQTLAGRLEVQSGRAVERGEENLARISSNVRALSDRLLVKFEERIRPFQDLPKRALVLLQQRERELHQIGAHVAEASPEVQLKRGFALLRRKGDERFRTRKVEFALGEEVEVTLADGTLEAKITKQ